MNNKIDRFSEKNSSNIFVVGIGEGGISVINLMNKKGISGVEYVICDTDEILLNKTQVNHKIHIENKQSLSEYNRIRIKDYTKTATVVFVIAGMGGETEDILLPPIIQTINNESTLTICILTIPFLSEGNAKIERAKNSIEKIRHFTNTVIELNSQIIVERYQETILSEASKLLNTIQVEMLTNMLKSLPWNSYLSVDYRDFLSVLKDTRQTVIGIGNSTGEDRVKKAIDNATKFSLFGETSLTSFDIFYIMIHCSQKNQLKMSEIEQIHSFVDKLRPNISFMWSACFDNDLDENVKVVAIAGKLNNKYLTDRSYAVDKVYF